MAEHAAPADLPAAAPAPKFQLLEAHAAAVPERIQLPPAVPPGQADVLALPPELAALQISQRPSIADAAPPASTQGGAAPPPSPPAARQVASVAVALAFAPGPSNGFSLSLEPAALGRVEVRVQRDGDSHSVRVTAERPETLALLQRDRHELDRGLAEAGLRVDPAGISFSLDTPDQGAGGFGGDSAPGHRGSSPGGAARLPVPEREASPPPRVLRSLLDLNI